MRAITAVTTWSVQALVAAAILAMTAPDAFAGLDRWTTGGPGGAPLSAIVGSGKPEEPVFVLSTTGGMFKTTDGGASWRAIDDSPLPATVSTLYRATDGVLYASFAGRVFVSEDEAETWVERGKVTDENIIMIAVDAGSGTVYAGTAEGIFTSADGGRTWQEPSAYKTSVQSLAVAPGGQPYAIVSVAAVGWLLVTSTDHGASWQVLEKAPKVPYNLAIDPITGVIAVGSNDVVYSSADGGSTWTSLGTAGLPKSRVFYVVITVSGAGRIATQVDNTMYEHDETARGKWIAIGNQLPAAYNALLVTSSNPRVFYAATGVGVYARTEPGKEWAERNDGIPSSAADVAIVDSQPSTAYAATSAGIFATHDSGETWARIYKGRPAQHIATTSDPNIVHAAVPNSLVQTTNGGQTWREITPGPFTAIVTSRSDAGAMYVALQGELLKSSDGGTTFKNVSAGLPNEYFSYYYYYYFYDESFAADSSNMNNAYVSLYEGLYKTSDGGNLWTQASAIRHGVIALDPQDSATVYAARWLGLDRSADSGATWQDVGLADKSIVTIAVSRDAVYAASTDGHVYRSGDRGDHWIVLPDGLRTATISKLSVDTADSLIFAATNSGVWEYAPLHNSVAITAATVDLDRFQRLIAALDNSPRSGFLVPAAAAVQGVSGVFMSGAVIGNQRNSPQDLVAVWLPQAYAGVVSAYRFSLPANSEAALEDLARSLGVSGVGSLAVVGVDSNGDLDPAATIDGQVTINMQPPARLAPHTETIGAFHSPAFSPAAARSVNGLRQDASARTNVGVVNLSAEFHRFTITATGERADNEFVIVVPPFSLVQTRLPEADYGGVSVTVTADDASTRWLVYASAVDNKTGDTRTSIGR